MLHFATQQALFPTELPIRRYAGIGSRLTPPDIKRLMTLAATKLEASGWILHSGGAKGADQAFEEGVHDPRHKLIITPSQVTPEAIALSIPLHPAPELLNDFAIRAHGRNAMVVLGPSLHEPVDMILMWAPYSGPPPHVAGGTGQAVRVALAHGVPRARIFNLYDVTTRRRIAKWVEASA